MIVHKNPWFKVEKHLLKGGGVYFFIKKPDIVFIIPETADGKLLLIREFRFPVGKDIWQFPVGGMEKETHLAAAKRELLEETGFKAKEWKKLGHFYVAPGHDPTKVVVFLAKGLTKVKEVEEENILEMKAQKISEIKKLIATGNFEGGPSLACFELYLNNELGI